jgi:hypothetical protein
MKRIVIMIALMLLSVGAWAQYAGTGIAKRAGTHIKVDGEKLSPEDQTILLSDIGGTDFNPAWQKAKAGRNAGMGLTIGGGVVALGGCTAVLLGATASIVGGAAGAIFGSIGGEEGAQQGAEAGASAGKPYITGGLIAAGAGLAAMGAGIPMLAVNCKKLNNIVGSYNAVGPEAQLSLGPTGNGFGITLSF